MTRSRSRLLERPAVGDDVVDLEEPGAPGAHLRERFVRRICSDSERAALEASRDPAELIWRLFAAKEAAYKVVARLAGGLPFAHRRFVVAADLRTVRYEDLSLELATTGGGGWVHAVATVGRAPTLIRAIERLREGNDPSAAARRLLVRTVAETVGRDPSSLTVARDPVRDAWDGLGPPRLLVPGSRRSVAVSLSHDGRFVSCAAALDAQRVQDGRIRRSTSARSRIASRTLRPTST